MELIRYLNQFNLDGGVQCKIPTKPHWHYLDVCSSPLCWIENVTEINQTFPNIPVPKEYVSIYCDLQANNPILVYLWSELPTQGLRFIVIWSDCWACAQDQLNVWRFSRWNLCLPTCTYKHLTQYSYFLIGCFNKLFPRLLSSFHSRTCLQPHFRRYMMLLRK